ncbi:MAG: transporter [Deltaproteobacteria bacterium]|nr:transporter [Deltaproteobacteria bacterium]
MKRGALPARVAVLGLFAACGMFVPPNVAAAPITFNTALPVASGEGILRVQYVLVRAAGDPTTLGRSITVHAAPVALAYGVTPRLALFGIAPFFDKSLELDTPAGRIERSASGIGDLLFLGRYTAFALDRPGSTIRLAPFAGLKLPTGKDDVSDGLGRLPRPLQPGSGSWDGLGGVVFTWQTLGWEFDADVGFRKNTAADGFRFGDQAFTDASFQYRVWPRRLEAGVPAYVFAVAESNLVVAGRDRVGGVSDPDSGGTRWNVGAGLQYVTERFVIEGIYQVPAVQRLNGNGVETDYSLSVGIRWKFSFLPGR